MSEQLWVLRMVEERFHRDAEDRPLREGRTPAEYLRPGDIEFKPCPYAGGRYQHPNPMNVSALRQTSAHWDDLLDALAFLRTSYWSARRIPTPDESRAPDLASAAHSEVRRADATSRGARPDMPDVMDLWRISQLGSALPWFFILRQPAGGSERTPAYAAALAKATLGMGIWAQAVFVTTLTHAQVPPLTPQTILALAEANGTLIGDTEVCSGSEKMLLRFFEAFFAAEPGADGPVGRSTTTPPADGPPGRSTTTSPADGPAGRSPTTSPAPTSSPKTSPAPTSSPNGSGAHVQRLVRERDAVMLFGAHYLGLKLFLWMHFLARRFLVADVIAALGPSPTWEELLDAPCEPPDFFVVGPKDPACVPPHARAAWFDALAHQFVPVALDASDAVFRDHARALARAMGEEGLANNAEAASRSGDEVAAPAGSRATRDALDPITTEVAATTGCSPDAAAAVARAIATYARLDAILGDVIATVEAAFRRSYGAPAASQPIDAEVRDRLVISPPRTAFAALAPLGLRALSRA